MSQFVLGTTLCFARAHMTHERHEPAAVQHGLTRTPRNKSREALTTRPDRPTCRSAFAGLTSEKGPAWCLPLLSLVRKRDKFYRLQQPKRKGKGKGNGGVCQGPLSLDLNDSLSLKTHDDQRACVQTWSNCGQGYLVQ